MQTKVPQFSQLVEYVTENKDEYIVNKVAITQHNLSSILTLTTLKADYQKLVLIRPAELLTVKELDSLKLDYALDAKLTAVYPVEIIELLKIAATKVDVAPIEIKPTKEVIIKG